MEQRTDSVTRDLSRVELIRILLGFLGIQFCWTVEVGYATKLLLQLGMSDEKVSLAWLAGPITGMVMQPIVGVLSDRCTSSYGRRRPFILVGSILSMISLVIFSFSREIGEWLGDPISEPRIGLCIAIAFFWILDFALNAAMAPLRALLADLAPPSQHKEGNAYLVILGSLGNLTAGLSGATPLSTYFPLFPSDTAALYVLAAIVLAVTVTVTLFSARETAMPTTNSGTPVAYERLPEALDDAENANNEQRATSNLSMDIVGFCKAFTTAPSPFNEIFTVQCFAGFAGFTLFIFGTSWVGAEVFHGKYAAPIKSKARALYDRGVRAGNFGMAMQSVFMILSALILPYTLQRVSVANLWAFANVLFGCSLFVAPLIADPSMAPFAICAFAAGGFAWAIMTVVPWALVQEAVAIRAPSRSGVYVAIFDLSYCIPQVVVSLSSGFIIRIWKKQASVLAFGGISAFLGAIAVFALRIGPKTADFDIK